MDTPKLTGNLRILALLRALGTSNVQIAFFTLFLVEDLHAGLALALQIYSSLGLLGALLEVPTGWTADYWGRKASLIAGSVCCITGFAMYGSAQRVGPWLFAGAVITYLGWSLIHGADSALAADICASSYSPEAASLTYAHFETQAARLTGLSMGCGSLLGSLLVWQFGLRSTMWAQVALYVPMLVCACLVRTPTTRATKVASIGGILRTMPRRRCLMAMFALSAVLSAFTNIMWKVVPIYYATVRIGDGSLPIWGLGLFWTICLGVQYLIRPSWPVRFKVKLGAYGSFAVLVLVGSLIYATMGVFISIQGLALVIVVFACAPLMYGRVQQRLCDLSASQERATIMSLERTCRYLAMCLGSLLVSRLVNSSGLSTGMAVAGVTLGLAGLAALSWVYYADRRAEPSAVAARYPLRPGSS